MFNRQPESIKSLKRRREIERRDAKREEDVINSLLDLGLDDQAKPQPKHVRRLSFSTNVIVASLSEPMDTTQTMASTTTSSSATATTADTVQTPTTLQATPGTLLPIYRFGMPTESRKSLLDDDTMTSTFGNLRIKTIPSGSFNRLTRHK